MTLARGQQRAASLIVLLTLAGCSTTGVVRSEQLPPDIVHLTIVGTNDLHGWLQRHEPSHPGDAPVGGISTFGGYINILRAERPDGVVLVDAGDLFQGTLLSNLTEGAAVIKAYNALQYDAAAVGNHEFDYGPEGDSTVAHTAMEDPLGALKARMREAHFPFLTGNIVAKGTNDAIDWEGKPTTLVHREGVTIGIIGLTTPTTPEVTLSANVAGLDFKPLAESTIALASELREHGAQVIVLAVHAGGSCPPGNDPHDLTGCEGGEIIPLMKALPPGTVDAVVAGHTHEVIHNFIDGVPVIESKAYGEAFGVIDLAFDRRNHRVVQSLTQIWPTVSICPLVFADTNSCGTKSGSGPLVPTKFLGREVVPDSTVELAIAPDIQRVKDQQAELLGPKLVEPFLRSRTNECDLGDFVTDIARSAIPGAQIAFMNSGGLRADIDAGPLTYGRVYNAFPFDNHVSTLKLTGAQVQAMVERGLVGDHGILQISGLRVEGQEAGSKPCKSGGSRVVSVTLDDGTPLVPDEVYTVVTNDFIATGGDGYGDVLHAVPADRIVIRYDLPTWRDEVIAWLRFHPELKRPQHPARPRITFVKPACASAAAAATP